MSDTRLEQLPKIEAILVEAPLEDVREYFRADAYSGNRVIREYYDKYPEFEKQFEHVEASGGLVNSEVYFGNCDRTPKPIHREFKKFYRIWGHNRISRVNSRPEFTLVEGMQAHNIIQLAETLAIFTQSRSYQISSRIAWSLLDCQPMTEAPRAPSSPPESHGLVAHPGDYSKIEDLAFDNRDRVIAIQHDGSKWHFYDRGTPLEFEQLEFYKNRRIKDRLTRNVICDYLEALGVDPEGTFERREVSDAILYTSAHDGEPIAEADQERYEKLFSS